ncbi:hypothetical protein OL548_20340 [Lysinibacillus sp. MHQ-1]|nr:hypothetical protein OL548_20340 [Lysinibacillus sp. MHQ-1]
MELVKLSNHKDEIGQMAQGITAMRSALRDITVNIQSTSNELVESSTTLLQIADDTVQTTDEIGIAISEIAKSTEEQAYDTEKRSRTIRTAFKQY